MPHTSSRRFAHQTWRYLFLRLHLPILKLTLAECAHQTGNIFRDCFLERKKVPGINRIDDHGSTPKGPRVPQTPVALERAQNARATCARSNCHRMACPRGACSHGDETCTPSGGGRPLTPRCTAERQAAGRQPTGPLRARRAAAVKGSWQAAAWCAGLARYHTYIKHHNTPTNKHKADTLELHTQQQPYVDRR